MPLELVLAWRNLWRQPKRTLLTTGAMVFSNVLLVFLISLQVGMYSLMVENGLKVFTGHLQVQQEGYIDEGSMRLVVPHAVSLADDLRSMEGIDAAARGRSFALASSEERTYGVAVIGAEPAYEPLVSSLPGLVRDGRYLEASDAAEIVIGQILARNLKVQIGDDLTLLGSGLDGSFAATVVTIVGLFETGIADLDRSISILPLGHFQEVFSMRDSAHAVVATTPSLDDVPATLATVRAALPDGEGLVVHDWDTLEPAIGQSIRADLGSSFFMYGVLVVLVAFSVLNTQLMSVLERTREFGIVMAIGLTPGRLGRLVLLESALMGIMGVVFGALLGGMVTQYFAINGLSFPGLEELGAQFNLPGRLHPEVTLLSLFLGPLIVFFFTLLATVYPASRLRRLQPVAAMRAA